MATNTFLFRVGDGNDGCFPVSLVTLQPDDSPYKALAALVVNRYIDGHATRAYVAANIETDGERDYGINAMVYEGPNGEQAFGAAWICAELQPLSDADVEYRASRHGEPEDIRDMLDASALLILQGE